MAACCLTFLVTACEAGMSSSGVNEEAGVPVSKGSDLPLPSPCSNASEVRGLSDLPWKLRRHVQSDSCFHHVQSDSCFHHCLDCAGPGLQDYFSVEYLSRLFSSDNGPPISTAQKLQHAKSTALSVFLRLLSEADLLEQVPPVLARLLESR